jgi:hypothetical protein
MATKLLKKFNLFLIWAKSMHIKFDPQIYNTRKVDIQINKETIYRFKDQVPGD